MPWRPVGAGLAGLLLSASAHGAAPCGDAALLGLRAARGALGVEARACVEAAYEAASTTASRERFHWLLVQDAAARRDWAGWERATIRHFEALSVGMGACADLEAMRGRPLGAEEVVCLEHRADIERSREASRLLVVHAAGGFDRQAWHDLVRSGSPGLHALRGVAAQAAGEHEVGAAWAWVESELSRGADPSLALGACVRAGAGEACCLRAGLEDDLLCQWPDAGSGLLARAVLGALAPEERHQLGIAMVIAGDRDERRRLSLLLLTDARAAGDAARFEALARIHLDRVEPRDPYVAWQWARRLLDEGRAEDAPRLHRAANSAASTDRPTSRRACQVERSRSRKLAPAAAMASSQSRARANCMMSSRLTRGASSATKAWVVTGGVSRGHGARVAGLQRPPYHPSIGPAIPGNPA